jgi:hypothetical protein
MVRVNFFKTGVFILAVLACAHVAAAQTTKRAPSQSAKPAASTASDETRETNLRAYVELLRSDLRSQKVAIITEVMQFTEDEDAKFWPVYREYENELAKINDDRIALVKEYAVNFDALTDAVADKLARQALELEGRRHALKTTYYDRIKSVLSPKTAARFFQVENQILLLLDLQIASALPLAK